MKVICFVSFTFNFYSFHVFSEIERLNNGEEEKKDTMSSVPQRDLHTDKPQKFRLKIRIPVREFPRVG